MPSLSARVGNFFFTTNFGFSLLFVSAASAYYGCQRLKSECFPETPAVIERHLPDQEGVDSRLIRDGRFYCSRIGNQPACDFVDRYQLAGEINHGQ